MKNGVRVLKIQLNSEYDNGHNVMKPGVHAMAIQLDEVEHTLDIINGHLGPDAVLIDGGFDCESMYLG